MDSSKRTKEQLSSLATQSNQQQQSIFYSKLAENIRELQDCNQRNQLLQNQIQDIQIQNKALEQQVTQAVNILTTQAVQFNFGQFKQNSIVHYDCQLIELLKTSTCAYVESRGLISDQQSKILEQQQEIDFLKSSLENSGQNDIRTSQSLLINKLQIENRHLSNKHEASIKQFQQLKDNTEKMAEQLSQSKKQQLESQNKYNQLVSENHSLQLRLQEQIHSQTVFGSESIQYNKSLQQTNEQLSDLQQQNIVLQQRINATEQQSNKQSLENSLLNEQLSLKDTEINNLKQKTEQLHQEISRLNDKVHELISENQVLAQEAFQNKLQQQTIEQELQLMKQFQPADPSAGRQPQPQQYHEANNVQLQLYQDKIEECQGAEVGAGLEAEQAAKRQDRGAEVAWEAVFRAVAKVSAGEQGPAVQGADGGVQPEDLRAGAAAVEEGERREPPIDRRVAAKVDAAAAGPRGPVAQERGFAAASRGFAEQKGRKGWGQILKFRGQKRRSPVITGGGREAAGKYRKFAVRGRGQEPHDQEFVAIVERTKGKFAKQPTEHDAVGAEREADLRSSRIEVFGAADQGHAAAGRGREIGEKLATIHRIIAEFGQNSRRVFTVLLRLRAARFAGRAVPAAHQRRAPAALPGRSDQVSPRGGSVISRKFYQWFYMIVCQMASLIFLIVYQTHK